METTAKLKGLPRTGGGADSSLQGSVQITLKPWWKRLIPHREDIIVAGREIKGGIVIHPLIASAILGIIVTLGLAVRSELNWQHDQLVILTTQKTEADARAKQEHDDRALQESADKAWRESMSNKMSELKNQFQAQQLSGKGGM